jgi:MobA/MobL family protein
MDWLYEKSVEPGGGKVSSGGSSYHLSFRSGSRGNGSCAHASYEYITRDGEYADGDRDPSIYTESDHMPSWAENDASQYWDAADLYERANGRLYVSADFALPCDLTLEDQVALAHEFAQQLTAGESLPYTLAIHSGRDANGQEHNPHAHLMISERKNDGIERSPEQWFSRANPTDPMMGGAEKSRTFHGREWVESARRDWAELTNKTMARLGREERVDHRSYERRGIEQEAGEHYGPKAAHVAARGQGHDRLEAAATVVDNREQLQSVEHEIAALELERAALVRHIEEHPEVARGYAGSGSSSRGRDDDSYQGR